MADFQTEVRTIAQRAETLGLAASGGGDVYTAAQRAIQQALGNESTLMILLQGISPDTVRALMAQAARPTGGPTGTPVPTPAPSTAPSPAPRPVPPTGTPVPYEVPKDVVGEALGGLGGAAGTIGGAIGQVGGVRPREPGEPGTIGGLVGQSLRRTTESALDPLGLRTAAGGFLGEVAAGAGVQLPRLGGAAATAPGAPVTFDNKETIRSYITQRAVQLGVDPRIPLLIVDKENRSWDPKAVGDSGTSFGLFQFHYASDDPATGEHGKFTGLGDAFTRETGLDARDPSTTSQQIDFTLNRIKKIGEKNWDGLRNIWHALPEAPPADLKIPYVSPALRALIADNGLKGVGDPAFDSAFAQFILDSNIDNPAGAAETLRNYVVSAEQLRQGGLDREAANARAANTLMETQRQFNLSFPLQQAAITGEYAGQPTLAAQEFGWRQEEADKAREERLRQEARLVQMAFVESLLKGAGSFAPRGSEYLGGYEPGGFLEQSTQKWGLAPPPRIRAPQVPARQEIEERAPLLASLMNYGR